MLKIENRKFGIGYYDHLLIAYRINWLKIPCRQSINQIQNML